MFTRFSISISLYLVCGFLTNGNYLYLYLRFTVTAVMRCFIGTNGASEQTGQNNLDTKAEPEAP